MKNKFLKDIRMKKILLFIWISIAYLNVHADSPITSTDFYSAYSNYPIVMSAKSSGVLDNVMISFLLDDKQPLEIKVAVINALSWNFDGKNNAELFKKALTKKYKKDFNDIKLTKFEDYELLCLGYLTVMDDYFNPKYAIDYLNVAREKNNKSFVIAMIKALIQAQIYIDGDWCALWNVYHDVMTDDSLIQDMNEAAIAIIDEYMSGYSGYCQ